MNHGLSYSTVGTGMALALVAVCAAGVQAQTTGKIAYINAEAILQATPAVQEAQQMLQEEMEPFRQELQRMATELDSLVQQYQQQQLTLSPEAKQARQAEIQRKQQAYQQRVQQIDEQASQRQNEVVQPIMDRINKVIEEIRAEGNYAIIFDVSVAAVIAADPSLNLTNEVLTRLQQTGDTLSTGGGPIRR